jgi:hypothetical protein
MNKKQLLKDGFVKVQKFLIITKDMNGKEHFCILDNLETAKKYKFSDDKIQPVIMYVKDEAN